MWRLVFLLSFYYQVFHLQYLNNGKLISNYLSKYYNRNKAVMWQN